MTVGKTHAGKSTFASKLVKLVPNAVIVESDPISEFLNKHHHDIYHDTNPNFRIQNRRKIHFKIWKGIIDHALSKGFNVILPNAGLVRSWRKKVIGSFRRAGAKVVLVYFDIDDGILIKRIDKAGRSKAPLTTSKDFHEVLEKQNKWLFEEPTKEESDFFLVIKGSKDYDRVLNKAAKIIGKK